MVVARVSVLVALYFALAVGVATFQAPDLIFGVSYVDVSWLSKISHKLMYMADGAFLALYALHVYRTNEKRKEVEVH